ncbi:hypothetical protein O6H91_07G039400 [Diphasiastrum complanatum]|nr:hypothetical protein O6H91_07G039400 [Diphasiastrum complanatum]
MFIRKQLTNAEIKYKRMGIIGALKLVSCLASASKGENGHSGGSPASGVGEALSLLQMTDEMCKVSVMACGFFYDELTASLEVASLDMSVIEWVSKHTNDFETVFLGDLEAGQIQNQPEDPYIEGELWFNLDGDISPICVNILPLLISGDESASNSLLFLPSSFRLLAAVESLTNKGALGGIDALLGCPIYLPKRELLVGDAWLGMSRRQKELSCLALYHAINWIRELINAFSTQIADRGQCLTQTTREETAIKLLKRLRNMLLLEHVLNECLKAVSYLKLPQLHFLMDAPDETRMSTHAGYSKQDLVHLKRGRKSSIKLGSRINVIGGQARGGISQETQGEKMKQSTISDTLGKMNRKASEGNSQISGSVCSQPGSTQNGTGSFNKVNNDKGKATQQANHSVDANISNDTRSCGDILETQKWKLRPLSLSSLSILTLHEVSRASCCSDPAAQLPLFLYLLQDLLHKLEICLEQSKKILPFTAASAPPKELVLTHMKGLDFLIKVESVSSSFRAHIDTAAHMLMQSDLLRERTACDEHWKKHSHAAGNPDNLEYSPSNFRVAESVFTAVLLYLKKVLMYSELRIQENVGLLKNILLPFCVNEVAEKICPDLLPLPASGSLEFAFCSMYAYLDGIFDAATKASFGAATELLMVLKSLVDCAEDCVESPNNRKRRASFVRPASLIPYLRARLSTSARRMLQHDWDAEEPGKIWKSKGEVLQNLLSMMIQNQESTADILEDLACNVMPQVPFKGARSGLSPVEGHPALSSATFIIWYRVQHEIVLDVFSKVVKDILGQSKAKAVLDDELVDRLLNRAHQCVSIHVALVNLTRKHDQISVHAVAVKCAGRFVDNFLKGLEFLQSHYVTHKEVVISLVKELQKATRIIQTICAEAKGQKKMPVTCKVPAVKRSMERYVFCIKALLHGASNGTSFWMGNLKHKDLQGQEIGSQLHASDDEAADEQSPNAEHEHASDDDESCDEDEISQDQS